MMDTKIVCLVILSVLVTTAKACNHVCDMQNPISRGYCLTTNAASPVGARACCLVDTYCPPASCTDWVNVSQLATYYDLAFVASDATAQQCDCDVVTCVQSSFTNCPTCP